MPRGRRTRSNNPTGTPLGCGGDHASSTRRGRAAPGDSDPCPSLPPSPRPHPRRNLRAKHAPRAPTAARFLLAGRPAGAPAPPSHWLRPPRSPRALAAADITRSEAAAAPPGSAPQPPQAEAPPRCPAEDGARRAGRSPQPQPQQRLSRAGRGGQPTPAPGVRPAGALRLGRRSPGDAAIAAAMGALTSRQHAGVEEVDIPSNSVYRYPPKSGEGRARATGRAEGRPRVGCCGRATRWPGRPRVGRGAGEVFGMQGGGRSPSRASATPRGGLQVPAGSPRSPLASSVVICSATGTRAAGDAALQRLRVGEASLTGTCARCCPRAVASMSLGTARSAFLRA